MTSAMLAAYNPVDNRSNVEDTVPVHSAVTTNFMSITAGNTVPMAGLPPIEMMSDYDVQRYFPYNAHNIHVPKYTFALLSNSGK